MISKLKSECGHLCTSKLEGMLQDMKLADDFMKQYQNAFNTTPALKIQPKFEHTVDQQIEVAVAEIQAQRWVRSAR